MNKILSLLALFAITGTPVMAQSEQSSWYTTLSSMDSSQVTLLIILGVVLLLIVLLLVLMIYLMSFMAAVFHKENPSLAHEPSWWESFKEKFVTGKMDEVGGKERRNKR